jgi:RNA polymerase sigma-70 factor (ECF subfamily)
MGAVTEPSPQPPPEAELVRRVQKGDRDAFELLARRYYKPIYAVVASFLPESADVEDAAQEVFLRALDRIQSFDPHRPFAPWLYQVARNVARNHLKSAKRRRTEPLTTTQETASPCGSRPDVELERAEVRRVITEAMEDLPEQQRTAFRLFDVEGYRAADVGALMGLSAASVRSNVYHARRALRARLGPRL